MRHYRIHLTDAQREWLRGTHGQISRGLRACVEAGLEAGVEIELRDQVPDNDGVPLRASEVSMPDELMQRVLDTYGVTLRPSAIRACVRAAMESGEPEL